MKLCEDFLVPLELVDELKKIGFNEPCILYHTYDRLEFKRLIEDYINPMEYSIADWYTVFKWLGKQVNLDYTITFEAITKPNSNDRKNNRYNRLVDNMGWVYKFKCNLDGAPDYNNINNWKFYNSYEEAQRGLLIDLIHLYKYYI